MMWCCKHSTGSCDHNNKVLIADEDGMMELDEMEIKKWQLTRRETKVWIDEENTKVMLKTLEEKQMNNTSTNKEKERQTKLSEGDLDEEQNLLDTGREQSECAAARDKMQFEREEQKDQEGLKGKKEEGDAVVLKIEINMSKQEKEPITQKKYDQIFAKKIQLDEMERALIKREQEIEKELELIKYTFSTNHLLREEKKS